VFRSARLSALEALLAPALGVLFCWTCPAIAQEKAAPANGVEPIVITGAKLAPPTDEQLTQQVETSLEASRYLDASRITVTTKNGVVTLDGLVGDAWDLRIALRIAGRVAGVRRLIDDLDIVEPDGFGGP
jgi:osmotically-inducible protein OsmY